MNVYLILDVRKNLISTNLLCKKDSKVIIDAKKVIFSKNCIFVVQEYSCDDIFKLSVNKVDVFYLYT